MREDLKAALLLLAQTCESHFFRLKSCYNCPLMSLYTGDCLLENIDHYDQIIEDIKEHEKVYYIKQNNSFSQQ